MSTHTAEQISVQLQPLVKIREMVIKPTDLDALKRAFQALGIDIQGGPGPRWGAHGDGTSLYVYDPDDNVVELRYY